MVRMATASEEPAREARSQSAAPTEPTAAPLPAHAPSPSSAAPSLPEDRWSDGLGVALLRCVERRAGRLPLSAVHENRPAASAAVLQRFPIPTASELEVATGYTGGTKWSRKWKTLKTALNTYETEGTEKSVRSVRAAAAAAHQTFDHAKKRKKVGDAVAVRVQAGLTALLADCRIELLRREYVNEYVRVETSGVADEAARRQQVDRLKEIRTLLLQTTDRNQVVAKFLAGQGAEASQKAPARPTVKAGKADEEEMSEKVPALPKLKAGKSEEEEVEVGGDLLGAREDRREKYARLRLQAAHDTYRELLVERLEEEGYVPIQDAYWEAPKQDPGHAQPHVAWKAHLGSTFEHAFELVEILIPLLRKLGVDHKIDTNPQVFQKTNKFVTIYPPGPKASEWHEIVPAIEEAVRGLTTPVEGELRVGAGGVVGMRHGQITSLTVDALEALGTKVVLGEPIPHPTEKLARVTLEDGGAPAPKIDDRASPGGKLVARGAHGMQMLWFVGGLHGTCPAVLHDRAIKPDPRKDPNPWHEPLPKGVALYGK